MQTLKRSSSGSQTLRFPLVVLLECPSPLLAKIDPDDTELVLAQVVYGLIMDRVFIEYGRLVEYFVNRDDSAAATLEEKLKYIDDIFVQCHANIQFLKDALRPYRDSDVTITDVKYDSSSEHVSFTLSLARPDTDLRRGTALYRAARRPRPDGRPLLRFMRDL